MLSLKRKDITAKVMICLTHLHLPATNHNGNLSTKFMNAYCSSNPVIVPMTDASDESTIIALEKICKGPFAGPALIAAFSRLPIYR
jgi:hypothetical protein